MIRTQIQLTARQMARLRRAAREQGVSLSELVRQLVDRGMMDVVPDREAAYERASRCVGQFRDNADAEDVGERHDDYLEDAYR